MSRFTEICKDFESDYNFRLAYEKAIREFMVEIKGGLAKFFEMKQEYIHFYSPDNSKSDPFYLDHDRYYHVAIRFTFPLPGYDSPQKTVDVEFLIRSTDEKFTVKTKGSSQDFHFSNPPLSTQIEPFHQHVYEGIRDTVQDSFKKYIDVS
jgi:hypothetical protein